MKTGAEAPDTSGITTVKEYNYVAAAKLPEVKGISSYKPMADRTVRFAINVWAGWSPIIYANNGFKPGKVWKTRAAGFKVGGLIDDPATCASYAAGNLHVGLPPRLCALPRRAADPASCRASTAGRCRTAATAVVPRGDQPMATRGNGGLAQNPVDSHPHGADQRRRADGGSELQSAGLVQGRRRATHNSSACVVAGRRHLQPRTAKKTKWTRRRRNKSADVWFARADFAKESPSRRGSRGSSTRGT